VVRDLIAVWKWKEHHPVEVKREKGKGSLKRKRREEKRQKEQEHRPHISKMMHGDTQPQLRLSLGGVEMLSRVARIPKGKNKFRKKDQRKVDRL